MSEYSSVLVVHRQESATNEIKAYFDRAGWAVHVAHTGFDGLLAARRKSYNLIVSVVDLPVITGIEMLRAIRTYSPNLITPAFFLLEGGRDFSTIFSKLNIKTIALTAGRFDEESFDRIQMPLASPL